MELTELWVTGVNPDTVVVTTCGDVPAAQLARAVRGVGRVMRRHHVSGTAQVRLSAPHGAEGLILVQATLLFRDTPTRVQVPGPGGFAVSFAAERLDRQLARMTAGEAQRLWPDPARPQLLFVTESRPIVRRKQVELMTATVTEATTVLDAMDFDAHLFTDAETGLDAAVLRASPSGVRLVRQNFYGLSADAATVHPHPVAELNENEAVDRLCRYGLPHLFFTDPPSGRGRLMYRRYDGDLGLVQPS